MIKHEKHKLIRRMSAMNIWILVVIVSLVATPAFADATADAKTQSEAFARAVNAGDVKAMLALYANNARVIWPGQGDEAKGKAEIEKLIVNTMKAFPGAKMTLKSQEAIPLGSGYIATIGKWEMSFKGSNGKVQTMEIRTSEVIKKQGHRTVYVIDHASVGLPPPGAEGATGASPAPQ
jgi:ketosteroid isomerase-like protein